MSKELSMVVDEHDEVIGYKPREDRTYAGIYRISALWLVNSKGQVLLAQRSSKKAYGGGLWGPAAAGTVEHGESYERNIVKEAEEEIGVSGVKFKTSKKVFIDNGKHRYFAQWFIGHIDRDAEDFKLQTEEVAQVKWVEPGDLFRDVQENPQDYVSSSPIWSKLFSNRL